MKTSFKMIGIFSLVMVLAVAFFAIYATRRFQASTDEFDTALNTSRLQSFGAATALAVEQQVSMMNLTIEELMDSPGLMATINQFVRDDTEEAKMGNAAKNSVLQTLYHSPLVDSFYQVDFYTRKGSYISSRADSAPGLPSGSPAARQVLGSLPWLDAADAQPRKSHLLPPHNDYLAPGQDVRLFGVVRAVTYHGNPIGYFEVSSELSQLDEIFSVLDNEVLSVQILSDDGQPFYARNDLGFECPLTLPENELTAWTPAGSDVQYNVMRIHSAELGMSMFLFQNVPSVTQRNREILWGFIRIALYISIPMIVLITLVSRRLTRSTRDMIKKVRQTPVEQVLQDDPEAIRSLHEMVTRTQDAEIHSLEHVFNDMMLRLRDSAANELALREGALQASLSALQSQINPHFVYNTLNIISAKSMESGNLDVIEICDQFAAMLRYATDTRSRTATLAEEIDNVHNYLMLAKARYEDNLEFTIDIPGDLTGITIPKLTLQPIVENALTHGYNGQNSQRRLAVTGKREGGLLLLEISDNGTGFPPETMERLQGAFKDIEEGKTRMAGSDGHIGLANTYLRLYYYSAGAMRVRIMNRGGAVVQLFLPVQAAN